MRFLSFQLTGVVTSNKKKKKNLQRIKSKKKKNLMIVFNYVYQINGV